MNGAEERGSEQGRMCVCEREREIGRGCVCERDGETLEVTREGVPHRAPAVYTCMSGLYFLYAALFTL